MTDRYTWHLQVEDREDADRGVQAGGSTDDEAALVHALLAAVGDARRHLGAPGDAGPDEEDGWELRATEPPPRPRRKPA
jgi:hypothetical protein